MKDKRRLASLWFKDKEREVRNDLPTKSQRVRKGMRFYKEK